MTFTRHRNDSAAALKSAAAAASTEASPESPQRKDLRPGLALRIGVTGHRDLPSDEESEIRGRVEAVLKAVTETVSAVGATAEAREVYAPKPPLLRIVSALAIGADQLVAEIGLQLGFGVHAALPFAQVEYERDFAAVDLARFRALFDSARSDCGFVALDGSHDEVVVERSYAGVGRFVVRNCDFLIAIWQIGRRQGGGGTADTVEYALRYGLPVIWIPPDRPGVVRVLRSTGADLIDFAAAPDGIDEVAGLIRGMLAPPPRHWPVRAHGLFATLRERWERQGPRQSSPLYQLLTERMPISRGPDLLYTSFLHLFRSRQMYQTAELPPFDAPPPSTEAAAWCRRLDDLAVFYANRHRSSFLSVYALAAVALICGVVALAHDNPVKSWLSIGELILLVAIGTIVFSDWRGRWHDRWLDYRTLAELLRQTSYLAMLGRALPVKSVQQLARPPRTGPAEWIQWYFHSALRELPIVTGTFDRAYIDGTRWRFQHEFVNSQVAYQHAVGETSRRASESLAWAGFLFFTLTLLSVLVKLLLLSGGEEHGVASALGHVAVIFPVLSAALLGLRAQAEFAVLATISRRLQRRLSAARDRLVHVDLSGPLSSNRLADQMMLASLLMLGEIEDWSLLFDAKLIELG